jgi:hypothetical protein
VKQLATEVMAPQVSGAGGGKFAALQELTRMLPGAHTKAGPHAHSASPNEFGKFAG